MNPLTQSLALGAALFGVGLVGFLSRRNLITQFLCAELMLQGVIVNFLAFGWHHGHLGGQVFALVIITVAACEAGLAMALFVTLHRRRKSLDSTAWQDTREAGLPPAVDTEPLAPTAEAEYPKLAPAGRKPAREESFYV